MEDPNTEKDVRDSYLEHARHLSPFCKCGDNMFIIIVGQCALSLAPRDSKGVSSPAPRYIAAETYSPEAIYGNDDTIV